MGKAIVFDGLIVESPVAQVTLVNETPTVILNYISKLSTTPSRSQIRALSNFYITLNDAGLWDKIRFLYPMFGNVADCAIGLVGDDLTIPTGAAYNNGLNLKDATGGIGPRGNGILLNRTETGRATITAMSCCFGTLTGKLNTLAPVRLEATPSDTKNMVIGYSSTKVRYCFDYDYTVDNGYSRACMIQTFNITSFAHAMNEKHYYNGELLGTRNRDGGEQTLYDYYQKWYLDGKNTAPTDTNVGCNMIAVFNAVLTDSEVTVLYNAVTLLQNALFI